MYLSYIFQQVHSGEVKNLKRKTTKVGIMYQFIWISWC